MFQVIYKKMDSKKITPKVDEVFLEYAEKLSFYEYLRKEEEGLKRRLEYWEIQIERKRFSNAKKILKNKQSYKQNAK